MRKPTAIIRSWRWWNARMRGETPAITTEPECGYYKIRDGERGPWCPASIALHQEIDPETRELIAPEVLICIVGDDYRDPEETWLWLAKNPISKAEYDYLCAHRLWAKANAPHEIERGPVDLSTAPIPEFG